MEILQGEIINCQEIIDDPATADDREYVQKIIRITTRQKQKIKVKNFANLLELCNPGCKSVEYTARLQNLCAACGGGQVSNVMVTTDREPKEDKDSPDGTLLRYRGPVITFPIQSVVTTENAAGGAGDGDTDDNDSDTTPSETVRRRLGRMASSYLPDQNTCSLNLLYLVLLLLLLLALYLILRDKTSNQNSNLEFRDTSSTMTPQSDPSLFKIKPDQQWASKPDNLDNGYDDEATVETAPDDNSYSASKSDPAWKSQSRKGRRAPLSEASDTSPQNSNLDSESTQGYHQNPTNQAHGPDDTKGSHIWQSPSNAGMFDEAGSRPKGACAKCGSFKCGNRHY